RDRHHAEGAKHSDEELADLNLYFHIVLVEATPESSATLLDQLNELDIVEVAYPEPMSEDPAADLWPSSPNYSGNQWYLGSAPAGIDANYARNFAGGRGDGVRVIDVEQNWNLGHEDLNPVFYSGGVPVGDRQHGTAVLGVLGAAENAYGMTGIAPRASIGVSSVYRSIDFGFLSVTVRDVADAVNRASGQLAPGDIILLEQHAQGPSSGLPSSISCNPSQFEFVAVE